jgi:oxygen-dependent protoporphyrinogen oxidase
VIVVGAGLAGLAAAHRLRSAGHAVNVLEAGTHAGGKHARETLGGIAYESWPALLPRGARAYAELAAEVGVARSMLRAPLARVGWLRDDHVHTGAPELPGLMRRSPLAPLRLRRLATLTSWLGGEIDPEAPERSTRLDDRSVADFCRVYLGRRALDQLLAPLFATLFGVDAAQTSRELLFALLDGRASLGLDRVEGTAALVDALATSARELRFDATVTALDADGRGVRLANGERVAADAVVLAVGAAEAMRLLPDPSPAEHSAAELLHTTSALVLAVVTDASLALPARAVWVPEREGGELAGVLDTVPGSEREVRLLRLVARPGLCARHGHRPDEEIAHFLIESATRVVPGLAGRIEAQRLHRFPSALPAFRVGHYRALERIRAAQRARPERRVFLAGDWLVAPHLEGELASGLRAAAEVRSLSARA